MEWLLGLKTLVMEKHSSLFVHTIIFVTFAICSILRFQPSLLFQPSNRVLHMEWLLGLKTLVMDEHYSLFCPTVIDRKKVLQTWHLVPNAHYVKHFLCLGEISYSV
jgi:hypothetical protein